ncbi:MAG TPA: DUF4139 domain-containing protein, partial [Candidatus Solibacter sp.]|nr:DUF4139 domain-containing protein [Candidatus Solibacter sp.]
MKLRSAVCVILTATLCPAADLPVRQVVLYKHGVGFFERSGKLGAGESARLDFDAGEMNDVLKSLTISERGGGKITGLRYDAQDTLSHRLAEFPFKIQGGMPGLLDQLKGARVELQFGNDRVAGTIVSARTFAGTDKQPEHDQLNLMMDSGEFRTLDLSAAASLRFTDPKLQQQFKDYLAAMSASRNKDRRSVYIDSTDAKERDVVASYMVPSPVWKSSYRLIFGEKAPTLEGWAIVDNTTGEDWTKVSLSLVSGRPISFVSQLYAPKYVVRPEAELADDAAARPVVHSGAFEEAKAAGVGGVGRAFGNARKDASAEMLGNSSLQAGVSGYPAPATAPPKPQMAPSTVAASATGQELGDLFEYRIAQPVTIRKNESAMLPFLQQSIDGRKLLIYSDHASQHPTNAAELTNSTGNTLDGGPITVYDGGVYGGEALMETLKAGEKRLISYAVDLGTRITEAFGSKQALVREVHATRGMLTTKYSTEETRTYTIRNVDKKAKALIIEHPIRYGYTLLNQKPKEKTATNYRFEVALAPDASQEFVVNEERVYDEQTLVTNMTPDMLVSYVQNRKLSDAARRQLEQIATQKRQIAENDRALQDTQTQLRNIAQDEDRVRRNIGSLNSVSGQQQLVQNYARQLDGFEQQLAQLRDKEADLQK